MGFKEYAVAVFQIIVGIVLIATGNVLPGVGFIISGLATAGSIHFRPDASDATDSDKNTYGFTTTNKVAGDTVRKVVYSGTGHVVSPTWMQMWITPRGTNGDDYSKSLRSRGQAISGLLHVCEGPIVGVENIRINDEPLFEYVEGELIGTGNGSKTRFSIDRTRVDLLSVVVDVNGASIGYQSTVGSELLGIGDGQQRHFVLNLPDSFEYERELKFYKEDPTRSDAATFEVGTDDDDTTSILPKIIAATPTSIVVDTQVPYPEGQKLYVRYWFRSISAIVSVDKDGFVRIDLDNAPGSGQEVRVNYRRYKLPHFRVEFRFGGRFQVPIYGLNATRNSYAHGDEVVKSSSIEFTTNDKVDDVYLEFASSPSGFTDRDKEGDRKATFAQFKIEMKRATATSTGNNYWDNWRAIPDPAGKKTYGSGKNSYVKNANEFDVRDDTTSQTFWSFGIRGILKRLAADNPSSKSDQDALRDFVFTEYTFRIIRTSVIKNATNDFVLDELFLSTHQEVIHDVQSFPGDVLMFFEGYASEKLNGRPPTITLDVIGKRDVQQFDGTLWSEHYYNQSNRVWAAIDFITNKRYGGGDHYTLARNIHAASALVAANWLDEEVLKDPAGGSETEVRSQLDIVLDTRKPLMENVRDICLPGGVWAVLNGDVWKFVVDAAVDLVDEDGNDLVPVIYDSRPAKSDSAARTFEGARDTIAMRATEVQVDYRSRKDRFEHTQAWVPTEDPSSEPRRILRATAYGITRDSEAARYARKIWNRSRSRFNVNIVIGLAPQALDFDAGDVVRVVSEDMVIDGYWRIVRISYDSNDFYSKVEATQYDPANYGQNVDAQTVLHRRVPSSSDPTPSLNAPGADDGSDSSDDPDGLPPPSEGVPAQRVRYDRREAKPLKDVAVERVA